MDRDAVRKYVEQSDAVLESSPQMGEATTKAAILRNFLELLGWKIPENTELEYSVKAFRRTFKVDYALVLEGAPVAFLEAKGVDTPLTDDHREQIQEYMKSEDVNLGILTNGEEYAFFRRRVIDSKVNVDTLAEINLLNLSDRTTILRAFTKSAIQNDEWVKILNRISELKEARTTLENKKDELATEITEVLTKNVSSSISSPAENQVKEMIDRLVADIESEIDADRAGSGGSTDDPTDDGNGGGIEPRQNHIVGKIGRSEIDGDDDAKVAVFPTKESGLPFLKENNAWAFVRVGSEFKYVAMYVTGDVRQVKYFAKVKDVVPPNEADLERPPLSYVEHDEISEGKIIVRFEPESLYELEAPVPYETKYPQSLQYTTLGALRSAETTDDML